MTADRLHVSAMAFDYINVFTSHVDAGFFHGSTLPGPARLLQGTEIVLRFFMVRENK